MGKTYKMTIAGCERELPLCEVSEHLDIAAFIMFGDVEVTVASARELLRKCPDFDIIVTAEAKGIPLGYEMARQSGKDYVVARKGLKVYMPEYVQVEVRSITTLSVQRLYIGTDDIKLDGMDFDKLLKCFNGYLYSYTNSNSGENPAYYMAYAGEAAKADTLAVILQMLLQWIASGDNPAKLKQIVREKVKMSDEGYAYADNREWQEYHNRSQRTYGAIHQYP